MPLRGVRCDAPDGARLAHVKRFDSARWEWSGSGVRHVSIQAVPAAFRPLTALGLTGSEGGPRLSIASARRS